MGQSSHPSQQQAVQQSVSLIGTPSSSGFVSGSLIPSSAVGTIPRTVPLTSLSQSPARPASTQPQDQQQWNLQQAQMVQQVTQQSNQQPLSMLPQQQQLTAQKQQQQQLQGAKPMDMSQGMGMMTQQQQQQNQLQKQQLKKGDDWSPGTDLSPILDVSPSLEAAEQELMEKCQDQLRPIPRATSGTISGMLADFNKALGLATTPEDGQPQRNLMVATTVAPPTQQPISGTVGGGGTAPQAVLPSSQASAPAYYGPDARGYSSTDAQEQVPDPIQHRRVPKARFPHYALLHLPNPLREHLDAWAPQCAAVWIERILSGHQFFNQSHTEEGEKL
ncbi:uncharacterized protein TNIN_74041 [Trichonephila inaurata madagascariensis]|uniref:Uncharacterized protein n=1 Tax=Trichonephila inaurata madagascariensis TaxID=2747483 RepID=A0A8X7C9A3_9ARAC|nr:uncharacterized protein TNIN_74041 [Trichonephila inaurata madagascariensis]